ncbi:MAG: hypothetical protein M3290_11605, partial [Actinomycetota bacterium]|nr:hypothetical protein [Actinomycetota bacterium]
ILRCKKEAATQKERLDRLVAEVTAVIGKTNDSLTHLDKQIESLRALIETEEAARAAVEEARAELGRRELAASKLDTEIDKLRERMTGFPLAPMCARARDAAPD